MKVNFSPIALDDIGTVNVIETWAPAATSVGAEEPVKQTVPVSPQPLTVTTTYSALGAKLVTFAVKVWRPALLARLRWWVQWSFPATNSGGWSTVTVMVTVWTIVVVPEMPVAVTLTRNLVPTAKLGDTVMVRVEVPEVPRVMLVGLRVAVVPLIVAAVRLTVPVNPALVTVIVVVFEAPWKMLTDDGVEVIVNSPTAAPTATGTVTE